MTSMMRMFSFSLILLIGVGMPVEQAEAKRFGGGMSFGKTFSTPKKTAPAPKKAAEPAGANKAATPAAKPGMGGLMGGLLAGGLLGALFFGGAFEGIQMMDILLMLLIGFAIFAFLGRMRKPMQQQGMGRQPEYAAPGSERYNEQQREVEASPQAFQSSAVLGGGLAEAELELPEWFNKEGFLEGAKQHFETLQHAWSENNLPLIETYCHPEFYAMLVNERQALGSEQLHIDVVSVMAELLGFEDINGEARVSINFYGWMKESAEADTTEYNEIWHLTRDTLTEGSDWYLVGIEQP